MLLLKVLLPTWMPWLWLFSTLHKKVKVKLGQPVPATWLKTRPELETVTKEYQRQWWLALPCQILR